jgi:PhnB protein
MPAFKPSGYNSVSPYLIVRDAAATLAFLTEVFAATPLRQFPDETGRLMHAEAKIDDTVIMLADAAPDWPALDAHVHMYVADVDATYAKALAFGAEPVQAPVKKQDADKRGGVKDAGGTTWWIATQMEDID